MQIKLKVFRYLPHTGKKPHYDTYEMEVDPNERVLDVLEQVRADSDPGLGYRRSCAHGVCGSDAMRINGRNMLACKVLVKDLNSSQITIEPLLGLKVLRDLIVDMEPFFEHFRSVMPYFVNDDPIPEDGKERLQTPAQRERFDDTTKCILCAACTTSCPSFWANGKYVGPAAIVNAHRFIFDSRDTAASERLEVLNESNGVWRCRTVFNCTEACPRDIEITKAIAEVKQVIISGKIE
ncbi:MAG: succinate dehydrogenase iron-sulfur subunit [Anaerolineaceae bacterium]|jgi:succinate dehydrogenase / fumarate reductase iron-sulfur subunit|nr:succinate dehydrogenase iron-sulfur subunit [Anaerolineaceae bacterium]